MSADTQPVFYYDLGSPACYLMAEQIMTALPQVPEWEPVLAAGTNEHPAWEQLDADARALGLQPLRPPARWPPQTRTAMLAATYAKQIGRAVAFSLAAFRQAFAGGRDLGDLDTVLIAAAACEMHPSAVTRALGLRSVQAGLEQAGLRALAVGVTSLPAIGVGGEVFAGCDALAAAQTALEATLPSGARR